MKTIEEELPGSDTISIETANRLAKKPFAGFVSLGRSDPRDELKLILIINTEKGPLYYVRDGMNKHYNRFCPYN